MANSAFDWNSFPAEGAGSKNGFDWNSFPSVEQPPTMGRGQTALEHAANGATLGYLPQIQALASKPIYAGLNAITGQDVQPDSYVQERDQNIQRLAKESKEHPITAKAAEVAGILASGLAAAPLLPEAGAASTLAGKAGQSVLQGAKTGAIYGAAANPGDTIGEVNLLQADARGQNAAKGAVIGATAAPLADALAGGVKGVAGAARTSGADAAAAYAEKSAVNATGATGKQASEFADNAGRELLDRGIVRFGDNQAKISQRATQAVDAANAQIDAALKKLDAKGVKVDANTIYDNVRQQISNLKTNPSQADIAGIMERELDNLVNATDAKGTPLFSVSEAEQIKRGYNRKAGNWMDPEKGQAGKALYQTYRGAVEDAAQAADPETAKLFTEGKKTYSLLTPIQEAAERRATVGAQSQHGNLLDVAATMAGETLGGPVMAVATPVARRVVAPRIASSLAVSADTVANALRKIPEFADLELKQPATFQAIVSHAANNASAANAAKAADQKPPTKGPAKWAQDGLNNLIQHAPDSADQLQSIKDKLLSNPKSKDLLVEASDMKPGSKGMDGILSKIKQTQKRED